jgi:hypothetical protein
MHYVIVTYAVAVVARQRLATQFQQYATVSHILKNQVAKIQFFWLFMFFYEIPLAHFVRGGMVCLFW